MELEVSKRYMYFSHSFNQMWFKFYEDIAYYGEIQGLLFLAIGQVLQIYKNPKMWNILKMADCRAKRMKSKLYTRYHNHRAIQAITLFWRSVKN